MEKEIELKKITDENYRIAQKQLQVQNQLS